jgi:hypothetical protein
MMIISIFYIVDILKNMTSVLDMHPFVLIVFINPMLFIVEIEYNK